MPRSALSLAASYAALELRRTLRDPQVVVFLGFPVVLYPSLIWGVSELAQLEQGRYDRETYVVAADAPLTELLEGHERLELVSRSRSSELDEGTVDATAHLREPTEVQIDFLAARPRSVRAAELVEEAVDVRRRSILREHVAAAGGDPEVLGGFAFDDAIVGELSQLMSWVMGLLIGAIGPLAMLLSGVYPAIDLFVVERERDTLETLLVSSVPRGVMVAGKLLACATLMLVASLANMGALGLSALHVTRLAFHESAWAQWPPLLVWPMLLATLASASLLCATVLMASLVPARTYKEGEWITTTVLFGSFPLLGVAIVGLMTGAPSPWLWAVPFAHTILAVAAAPTGELALWQAALSVTTDVLATSILLALLWRSPGPQGLLAGAWRPPWLDRLLGSS